MAQYFCYFTVGISYKLHDNYNNVENVHVYKSYLNTVDWGDLEGITQLCVFHQSNLQNQISGFQYLYSLITHQR